MLIDLMVTRANSGRDQVDVQRYGTFTHSIGRVFKRFWRLFS
jgi:hypothetical protein